MSRTTGWLTVFLLALLCLESAHAQEARFANGVAIKGEVLRAVQEGLEIQTPTGRQVYPWALLSAGTRYRYQPAYKANIGAIQEGRAPSERKSTPALPSATSPTEAPAAPEPSSFALVGPAPAVPTPAPPPAPAPAPKPAPKPEPKKAEPPPAAQEAANMFGFSYATPNVLLPRNIPGLKLRDASLTIYQAFQHGPGADDMLYLVFDAVDFEHPHDVMFVHAPSIQAYARTILEKGQIKGPASNREVHFKPITFSSQYGSVSAKYELSCVYAGRKLKVSLRVDVVQGMQKSSYQLYLEPTDLFSDGSTPLKPKRLFDIPVLSSRYFDTQNKHRLGFALTMGPFFLTPVSGMEKKMTIQALADNGKVLEKQNAKMDEVNYTGLLPTGYRFSVEKLKPGESCMVQASINLGPIFGPLHAERKAEREEKK